MRISDGIADVFSSDLSRRLAIRFLNIAVARLRRSAGGVQASHEAVRIDIDRYAHLGLPVEPAEPVADHVLHVQRAARVDQQAEAVAPPPDRKSVGKGKRVCGRGGFGGGRLDKKKKKIKK